MKTIRILLFLVCSLFIAQNGFAAPAPPSGTGPTCWPPPCIPIDGGISFLVVAGAAYGAKKLHSNRKVKNS